ncbi:MAG: class II glutamine amidotransferase [Halobacteriovoraceae bacterium]|nr:class II glutamine amidotransferase [Halobacteriovoraceae bacterium]
MCRLFGFKSVINSQVHSSLIHAENALVEQSIKHPDGWGVAYYLEDVPHVIKSMDKAIDDHIFERVSGVVSSKTVVAHIRKATHGEKTILNSHPFQYGRWIFAHNGNLKNFDSYRQNLLDKIDPELRRFVLGTTDSEIIFFLILSYIKDIHPLHIPNIKVSAIKAAIESAFQLITSFSGPLCKDPHPKPTENHLTFILTTGTMMLGFNGGQKLHYSTYKTKCSERESCPFFAPVCEAKASFDEPINHLIFSSEKLAGENIWTEMDKGELIAIDHELKFLNFQLNVEFD